LCKGLTVLVLVPENNVMISARRSAVEQDVLALIAPLAKLGRFQATIGVFSN
jgi:hypothetical protein